jgi:hypothetical protein
VREEPCVKTELGLSSLPSFALAPRFLDVRSAAMYKAVAAGTVRELEWRGVRNS